MAAKNAYPNSGFINQNTRKNKPNQPDIVGTIDFQCPENGKTYRMRLAGWEKENDRGKYYSIKVQEEQEKPANGAAETTAATDPNIPF